LFHHITYAVGGFAFLAIFLGAVGSSTENTSTETPTPAPGFYYPPQQDDMRYSSCSISNIRGGFGVNATMADYIYMAGAAYLVDTQGALDNWFGEGVVVDEEQLVTDFRNATDTSNSAVFFKLFNFTDINLAIISIRGTTTSWDMLADAQLWAAASLMQGSYNTMCCYCLMIVFCGPCFICHIHRPSHVSVLFSITMCFSDQTQYLNDDRRSSHFTNR
jgi:hypothetical protein